VLRRLMRFIKRIRRNRGIIFRRRGAEAQRGVTVLRYYGVTV